MLDRKLLRELRAGAGLLLAIAGIIASGVACFVTMRTAYAVLRDAQSAFYARCRMADFTIDLKRLPGVDEVLPRIQASVTVDLDRGGAPRNGLALSLPERRASPIINDIVIRRGGDFTDRRDDEVIVNDAFARANEIALGDRIYLLLNDRRQALHVVGTAISSEFVYLVGPGGLVPDPEQFGVFYLKRRYFEEIHDFRGACNQIVGRLSPETRARPEGWLDRAERLLADYGVLSTTPRRDQVSDRFLSDEIEQLGKFAFVLPMIFLVVAALVLGVLMARMVDRQRTVIGTLKGLGYGDGVLFRHLLKYGAAVGLIGGLAGCALGAWLASAMATLYQRFFELPDLRARFLPGVYATGLAFAAGCATLGAARSARQVLRLQPAEAMRPKPPARGGPIPVERIGWLWARLGTGTRMVLRHLFRHGRRTAVVVLATALAMSLLVTGLMGRDAMIVMLDLQFGKILRSDVDLTFRTPRGRDALLESRRIPTVEHAEPVLDVACTFRNGHRHKRGAITGVVPGARLSVPRDAAGRPVPIPGTGVVLARGLARELGVGVGDALVVEPSEGRRRPRTVIVAGLADTYIGLAAYADLAYLARLVEEEFALGRAQLAAGTDTRSRARRDRILKQLPALAAVNERVDVLGNLTSTLIDTNQATTAFLIGFAGLIVFGTSLNAALVGLEERRREVATLRALGYSPWAVGGLFVREGLALAALGTMLGLPLGQGLFLWMIHAYETDLFRIPEVSPWPAWRAGLALGLGFALLAQAFVQRAIHRDDWLGQLKAFE
jgi:putative ABC transport system permease protein